MMIAELVQQVSNAIENAEWNKVEHGASRREPEGRAGNMEAYESVSGGWRLLVAEMDGYADGTATSKATIVRMTPKQARDAIGRARG